MRWSCPIGANPGDGRGAEKGLQGFQDTHKREWLSAQRAIDVGQFLVSRLLPELQMDRGCATDRSGGFCLVRVDEPGVERLPIWTIRR